MPYSSYRRLSPLSRPVRESAIRPGWTGPTADFGQLAWRHAKDPQPRLPLGLLRRSLARVGANQNSESKRDWPGPGTETATRTVRVAGLGAALKL